MPWLVWLSGLSAGLRTKGSSVQFPVKAHAGVVGQGPSGEHERENHTFMFLSVFFHLPSPLFNKIKSFLKIKNQKESNKKTSPYFVNKHLGERG